MQPPLFKRARFLHVVVGGLLLIGMSGGTLGCSSSASGPEGYTSFGVIDTISTTEASRDSALAVLGRMNRTPFDSAFSALSEYTVTRHVRTEQLDTTGTTTAHRTLTLRYPPGDSNGAVQRADSAGSFRGGGLLSGITPAQEPTARPANLAAQTLPDQPAYLSPRTQEAYRYALRRDSLLDGRPVIRVEAKARTDERGADQSIRYARLTIDRASNALVGLTTSRVSRLLLFRENSAITIRLRHTPENSPVPWVPHLTRFRAVVDVPLRSPRQFRTVSGYYGYASE